MAGSSLQKYRVGAVLCCLVVILNSLALAENVKIEGFIVGRSGDEIIVKFGSGAELAFQLTDNTQVSQIGGLFNARRKQMAMAALIPGLKVKVEGVYNEQRQVLATKINFKGEDLEDAQKIQAGMHETKMQAQQNKGRAGAAECGAASAKGSFGKAAGGTHRTAEAGRDQ